MIFSLLASNTLVYAYEPIPITKAGQRDMIVFDGKWTQFYVWKQATLTSIDYENEMQIKLRTSHQGDFIYVLIDFLTDTHIHKGIDMAMICFDGKNEKNTKPDSNDFCFSVAMQGKNAIIYQGENPTKTKNKFTQITHNDFIGVGNVSDENDRYSKIPHASYEFKIPIEIFDRSDFYGFYMAVYDSKTDLVYTWPKETKVSKYNIFSSPDQWGEIYSPDKSLPEFSLPMIFLLISLFFVILLRQNIFKIKYF